MAKRDDDFEFSMTAAFDEYRSTDCKVPLYLINGSLGAGKTTVLEFLLRRDDFHNARVIENEYANENVDGYRLESLTNIVTTLSGDCICCTTGDDALVKLLNDFTKDSGLPVFIEATGVSRTMNLIDRLVKSGMLSRYELMHSFYVISARELMGEIDEYKEVELQLADTIIVTKRDLLNDDERAEFDERLDKFPYGHIMIALNGKFDVDNIETPSSAVGFFDAYDGEINVPDNPTYSVIDTSHMIISANVWDKLWISIASGYGLRRMKGAFKDNYGSVLHIEATPEQVIVSSGAYNEPLKLVLIGDEADRLTRDVLAAQIMLFSE